MPDHDDNTGLLNLALEQYGSARRWRIAALATWTLIGIVAMGWAWSLWLVRP